MLKLRYGSNNIIEILSNLRTKAFRKGIWFQTLTDHERILTGLLTRHIKIVKSATLATLIARIMGKLIYAINNCFMYMIESKGRPIAESWSRAACAMGWKEAAKWIDDRSIVRWFGLAAYYSNRSMR